MYKDLNGDGKISSGDGTLNDLGDLKVVANTQLRFKYGLTLDASWKGFDFSAFFQGVGKRDVQNYLRRQQKEANEPVNNAFAQALSGIKL